MRVGIVKLGVAGFVGLMGFGVNPLDYAKQLVRNEAKQEVKEAIPDHLRKGVPVAPVVPGGGKKPLTDKAKGAAKVGGPLIAVGGIVVAEEYVIDKGAPHLENTLEWAQKRDQKRNQKEYQEDQKDAYCELIPEIQNTEGCK